MPVLVWIVIFTILGGVLSALAASVFHSAEIPIPDLKHYLAENQVDIRL